MKHMKRQIKEKEGTLFFSPFFKALFLFVFRLLFFFF